MIANDVDVAVRVGVVDEKESVRRVVRMKGEAEESALAAAGDERVDIEERRRQKLRAVVDDDLSALRCDEEPRVARVRDSDRNVETGDDRTERDRLRDRCRGDEKKSAEKSQKAAAR